MIGADLYYLYLGRKQWLGDNTYRMITSQVYEDANHLPRSGSVVCYIYLNICPYVEICAVFLFFPLRYYCVTTGDFFLHPPTVPEKKVENFRHPSIQVCVALHYNMHVIKLAYL